MLTAYSSRHIRKSEREGENGRIRDLQVIQFLHFNPFYLILIRYIDSIRCDFNYLFIKVDIFLLENGEKLI